MKKNNKKDKKDEAETPAFKITSAVIKDNFCHYTFEILKGIGAGDTHTVKGKGIIEDDMLEAFAKFNVHLAAIDDVFKHSKIEIKDIDKMHNHELALLFNVTGFRIKGERENETIVLMGSKYVSSAGGRIELESPKITLDKLSSYEWYNELNTAMEAARNEVELYKNGKYTAVEPPAEEENTNQLSLVDNDQTFEDGKQ